MIKLSMNEDNSSQVFWSKVYHFCLDYLNRLSKQINILEDDYICNFLKIECKKLINSLVRQSKLEFFKFNSNKPRYVAYTREYLSDLMTRTTATSPKNNGTGQVFLNMKKASKTKQDKNRAKS